MNKRIKKKKSFDKCIYYIGPGISENIDECPIFRAFSVKSFFKLFNKLRNEYDCEFMWVNTEFPYKKFRSRKEQVLK